MKHETHKLPTAIKKLRGTDRADRIIKDEIKVSPLNSMPIPPDWLGDVGKNEWYNILQEYLNIGMFSNLDLPSLLIYCQAYDDFVRYTLFLKEIGETEVDGRTKREMPRPELALKNKAAEIVLKHAREFGLTPVARTRISNPKVKEEDTSFSKYFEC